MLTRGPPECPGFTAASLWMKPKPGAATSSGAPLRLTTTKEALPDPEGAEGRDELAHSQPTGVAETRHR